MYAILFTVLLLVVLPLASLRYGVDSRDDRPGWPFAPREKLPTER